jgi:tetratricopeptide (TPR) repeat protein
MLETIREYALERLEESSPQRLRLRHAEHFASLTEAAGLEARRSDQPEWLDRLEAEEGNWRAALEFATTHRPVDLKLRLVVALGGLWVLRGYLREGSAWVADALADASDHPPALRTRLLAYAISLVQRLGKVAAASRFAEERLALANELGDPQGRVDALIQLGFCTALTGDYSAAQAHLTTAVHEAEHLEPWVLPTAQLNLGFIGVMAGDESAEPLLQEGVRNARSADNVELLRSGLVALACAQRLRGQPETAATSLLEALRLLKESRAPEAAVDCLTEAVGLLAPGDHKDDGARLLGAVNAITERIGLKQPEWFQRLHDDIADTLQNQLGHDRFDAALDRGTQLQLDDAVTLAIELLAQHAPRRFRRKLD